MTSEPSGPVGATASRTRDTTTAKLLSGSKRARLRIRALGSVTLLCALAGMASAQTGQVRGLIVEEGGPIGGATVTLTQADEEVRTNADAQGRFYRGAASLPPEVLDGCSAIFVWTRVGSARKRSSAP